MLGAAVPSTSPELEPRGAGLFSSPLLQNFQKQIPDKKKSPKAQLCALGAVCRSRKAHRGHQRAPGTQLLWGFAGQSCPPCPRGTGLGWDQPGAPLGPLKGTWIDSLQTWQSCSKSPTKTPRLPRWKPKPICMVEQFKDGQWGWFAKITLKPKIKRFKKAPHH